jgi:major membrane immunogen (membrane-anchored lipoprotein)
MTRTTLSAWNTSKRYGGFLFCQDSFLKSLLLSFSIETWDNLVHTSYAMNKNIYKGATTMKKFLPVILLLLLVLTACGTQEKEDAKTTPEENKTEENANANKDTETTRELTAEDEKFSQMLLDKDYQTIVKETVTLKSESQKDFYYLASAFIKLNEIQAKPAEAAADLKAMQTDYTVIVNYLNRVKFVPDTIKGQVDELRKVAEEKQAYYQAEVEKQPAQ